MNKYTKEFIRSHLIEIFLSIPKTVYLNFKALSFRDALHMPIVISWHVKIRGVNRNNFILERKKLSTASVRIGFGDSAGGYRENKKSLIKIVEKGSICIKGTAGLSQGIVLIADNCCVTLGNHFRCNYSTTIDASNFDICFGDEVVCGWNVTLKNDDGHTVIQDGKDKIQSGTINIGNHVWLCAHSTILKNVDVGDNCIVAYGSMVTKADNIGNILYAGTPAKPIRDKISWKE